MNTLRWQNLPLALKLTLAMASLLILAVAAQVLLSINREQQIFRSELEQQANVLLDTVAEQMGDALYTLDIDTMEDTLRGLSARKVVLTGQIFDGQGRLLADSDGDTSTFSLEPDPYGQRLVASQKTDFDWQADRLIAGRAVVVGNQRLGAVSLGLPTGALNAKIAGALTQGLAVMLALALLGAGLAIVFSRSITNPLNDLKSVAQNLMRGDLSARAQVTGQDEVGTLGSTFNEMSARLQRTLTSLEQQVIELQETRASLEQQNAVLEVLQTASSSLVRRLDLEDLLAEILLRAGELVNTQNGYVFLLDPHANEMVLRVGVGAYQKLVGARAQPGVALAGQVWQTGEAVAVDDYRNWSGRLADPSRNVLRAVAGVPLKSQDKVMGIIGLAHLEPEKRFGSTEMDVLDRFASLASVALDNAQLYESAQRELMQRRRAEKELSESEARKRAIVETTLDCIISINQEGNIVEWNPAAASTFGFSRDQALGKDMASLIIPPSYRDQHHQGLKRYLHSGEGPVLDKRLELSGLRSDGSEFPIELSINSTPVGDAVLFTAWVRDISERRRREQQLRESEARFRSLADNVPSVVYICNNDARYTMLYLNDQVETLTGIPKGEFLADRVSFSDLYHPEDSSGLVEKVDAAIAARAPYHLSYRFKHTSGEWRWVDEIGTGIFSSAGELLYLEGLLFDITERLRAEQELRESEERYRDLFENANDLIQSVDAEGHFLYVNRAWKEVLGYTDQDLETLTFLEVVHPDERQNSLDLFGRVMQGENISEIETAFRAKDGRKVLIEGSTTPRMEDGKVLSTRSIFRDVTERRLSQAHTAYQNALLAAQYDVSPDGILVVGADDRILTYNRRFIELWNVPDAVLAQGTAEALRQAVREQLADVEGWLKRTGEIYMSQEKSASDEIVFKDGQILERSSSPINTPEGTHLGRVWFFHDVTARRRAEQAVRRVVEGTRAILWRAEVTRLEDETQESLGFRWSIQVSNPDTAMQYLPFQMQAGKTYEDVLYAAILAEDRVMMDYHSAQAFRTSANGYTQEYRVRDANGILHWMNEDVRIRVVDDTHFEVVGVTTDVTERHYAQEQIAKQNAYLSALQETSLGLVQRLDVNALLEDIVARAGALVGTENGYVFLREPEANEMELRVGVGAYEGFVGRRVKPGVGLAGQVWETNAPVVVDDYRIWGGRLADASRDILRAVVGVPLRSETDVVGIIGLAYLDETRKFGEVEIQVLQRFAQLATIALDNARLYQQANDSLKGEQQQRRLADALANATGKLASTLDESEIRRVILDEINELLKPDQISLYEGAKQAQVLRLERRPVDDLETAFDDYRVNTMIPAEKRADLWQVFWEGKSLYEPNPAPDGLLREHYCLPWFAGDSVAGVIEIYHTARFVTIRPSEQATCQAIIQQAGIAIQNARLFLQTEQEVVERTRAEAALAHQLRETEFLNRVTTHAVNMDIDNALTTICRDLTEYFGVKQAGVAVLSEDRQSLTVVAEYSPQGAPDVIGYVIPVQGNPSTKIVMETRQAVAFVDAQTDPRLAAIHDLMRTRDTASLMIAPLIAHEEIFGTLGIDSAERREFTEGDVALVQRVAVAIATALENARLYRAAQQEIVERTRAEREMRQRNQELEVISRISAVLTTNIDMQTALETMARELVQTFKARNCGIALLNPDQQSLTVVADALTEGQDEHAVGIVIPVENNPSTQYVLTTRHSLIIPDAQTDPMTEPIHERMRQRQTKCLAIIPLLSGGQVIGTIGLDTTDPEHIFSEEEIRLAETMANQMANAIEKQRLFDQTKERARREQLTREIGADLTRSLDMETIVQTMARELSHALGASHAVVRMGAKEQEGNGGPRTVSPSRLERE